MRVINKYREIITYAIVGGLTTVVNMILFYACVWTFLDGNDAIQLQIANLISWIGSVIYAYIANRVFVFKSHNPWILKEAVSFVSTRVLTLLLNMLVMFVFSTILRIDYNFVKLLAIVLVAIGNYVISKLLIFRK